MQIRTRIGGRVAALPALALPVAVAMVVAMALAGCGGAAGPPALNLAVTVPVNKATVGVRAVDVVGTVSANRTGAAIALRVHGRRTRVHPGGAFTAHVQLHHGVNRIRLVAVAPGFPRAVSTLQVRFGRPRRPPLTLAERVNAICGHDSSRQFLLASGAVTPNLHLLRRLLALDEATVSHLAALRPPAAQRASYAGFVSTARATLTSEQALISDVEHRSLAGIRADAHSLVASQQRFNGLAQPMGFIGCLTST